MKKLALAVVLSLGFQMIPVGVFAATGSGGPGGFVALAVLTDGFGIWAKKDKDAAKKGPKEFIALNKSSNYDALVNQSAAGKLNTLDIVKQ